MAHLRALLLLPLLGLFAPSIAQITLDPLVTTTVCSGTAFDVSFQALGTYDPGNVFSVQLSDATGDFSLPLNIGSIPGIASGTISCTAPGADGSGYRVRVASSSPLEVSAASAEILQFANPNAGMSTAMSLCGISASLDLTNILNGSPDAGGVWTIVAGTGILVGPDGPYIGLTYGSNILEYTVDLAGCTASTQVTVNCVEPPNAGVNTVLLVCSSGTPVDMFMSLNGSPQSGGSWTAPNGAIIGNMFDPSVDPSGMYIYTVVGDPSCTNASATLLITLVQAPNAGSNASVAICASDAPFAMISQLLGSPAPGGTWTFNSIPHAPVFVPGTDVSGVYTYTVLGNSPCTSATATVTVTVNNCFQQPGNEFHPPYPDE